MQSEKERELATKKVSKLFFTLAIPTITAQIINLLYNLVDRMYIGRIDDSAFTGVGITLPIITLIAAFSALVGMGGAPKAAIFLGEGKKDQAEKVLGNSMTLLILFAVTITGIVLLFGEEILVLFGASGDTLPYALEYILTYALGTIFVQITLGLNPFITTQGFAKISMKTVLIGAILNIILDPIFIFVFDFGVMGAAIATVISQCVSAVWVLSFLFGKKTILKIKKGNLKLDRSITLPCLALGFAPFIMQSTESLLSVCFNTSLLQYGGDLAVGGMTIFASCTQLMFLPVSGLCQGAQPIISYNYGANNAKRVNEAFWLLLKVGFSYTMIFWLAILFMPQVFAGIFTNSPELIAFTVKYLRVYMGVTALMGLQIICQQTMVSMGFAGVSSFLALLRKVILLIPLIYIMPNFFDDKVFAVFFAEPVADFIAVTTTVTIFIFQFKKAKEKMRLGAANIQKEV